MQALTSIYGEPGFEFLAPEDSDLNILGSGGSWCVTPGAMREFGIVPLPLDRTEPTDPLAGLVSREAEVDITLASYAELVSVCPEPEKIVAAPDGIASVSFTHRDGVSVVTAQTIPIDRIVRRESAKILRFREAPPEIQPVLGTVPLHEASDAEVKEFMGDEIGGYLLHNALETTSVKLAKDLAGWYGMQHGEDIWIRSRNARRLTGAVAVMSTLSAATAQNKLGLVAPVAVSVSALRLNSQLSRLMLMQQVAGRADAVELAAAQTGYITADMHDSYCRHHFNRTFAGKLSEE